MGLVHRHNLGPQGLTPALLLLPLQPCLPRPCPSPCFSVPRHLLQGTAVWELAHQFIRPLTCLLPAACRECALRAQCPLCAAACLSETGRTDIRPEYVCRMTHELAEAIRKKYPLKEDRYEGE